MKNVKNVLFTLIMFIIVFVPNAFSETFEYGDNQSAGKYFKVNGINLYYEIYGIGKPLVLLHGNGGSIDKHKDRINHYKLNYKVIIIDARAHGKSGDQPIPLTFKLMTNDIAKLLKSLKLKPVLVWGQSDGGIIALMLAMDYPNLVEKVAAFGVNTKVEGIHDGLTKMLEKTIPTLKNEKIKKHYSLLRDYPNIKNEDLKKITKPVLLMFGDRDAVKNKHMIEMFESIPNSNLFIMPGATHFGAYENKKLFYYVLDNYFKKDFSAPSTLKIFLGANYKEKK